MVLQQLLLLLPLARLHPPPLPIRYQALPQKLLLLHPFPLQFLLCLPPLVEFPLLLPLPPLARLRLRPPPLPIRYQALPQKLLLLHPVPLQFLLCHPPLVEFPLPLPPPRNQPYVYQILPSSRSPRFPQTWCTQPLQGEETKSTAHPSLPTKPPDIFPPTNPWHSPNLPTHHHPPK